MKEGIVSILTLVGSLGLFLYGMKLMSESLQKITGNNLRSILAAMTKNRFMGVFTGVLITTLIQSSSATTVIVVSFVNAGLLTLFQSITVIMGANIGTTVTAWMISLFGFKVNITDFTIPIIAFALPFIFSKLNKRRSFGECLLGFALLFMGLEFLKQSVPDLGSNPEALVFLNQYTDLGFGSVLIFVFIGTAFTIAVQSSSATMAITLIMCSKGWISFELAAAMVLGENIGTTITANIAAITANTSAKRTALAHLVFNIFGVVWMLFLFYPFTRVIADLVAQYGPGDPTMLTSFSQSIDNETLRLISSGDAKLNAEQLLLQKQLSSYQIATSYSLALFHSVFNIINTLIMVWFVNFISKIVTIIIKKKESDEEFQLKHISTGMLSTSEISILQASKEIINYGTRTKKMFHLVQDLYTERNENESVRLFSKIQKYESISDRMEVEIATYLSKLSEGRLSDVSKHKIQQLMRAVSEIESIGDGCFNIARTILRQQEQKIVYPDYLNENILHMFSLVEKALNEMQEILMQEEANHFEIVKSINIEQEINNYRNKLKKQNLLDINEMKYKYEASVVYMDTIMECEKMGDYIINVVESYKEINIK